MIRAATLCDGSQQANHTQAATLCVLGALAGQQGKPDLPSAAFHLLVAAAAGDARSLRDLRCLAQVSKHRAYYHTQVSTHK